MTAKRPTSSGLFGTILRFIRSALLATVFDPVAFISIFAPILISIALGLIYGQFVQANLGPKKADALDQILASRLLPGILDFIIQYYTALLVLVVSFGKSFFNDIVLPSLKKPSPSTIVTHDDETETTSIIGFHIYGIVVLLFGIWVLFLGASKLDVLQVYTEHTLNFNTIKMPPAASPITWLRVAVWFYSIWRFILERRMLDGRSVKQS